MHDLCMKQIWEKNSDNWASQAHRKTFPILSYPLRQPGGKAADGGSLGRREAGLLERPPCLPSPSEAAGGENWPPAEKSEHLKLLANPFDIYRLDRGCLRNSHSQNWVRAQGGVMCRSGRKKPWFFLHSTPQARISGLCQKSRKPPTKAKSRMTVFTRGFKGHAAKQCIIPSLPYFPWLRIYREL